MAQFSLRVSTASRHCEPPLRVCAASPDGEPPLRARRRAKSEQEPRISSSAALLHNLRRVLRPDQPAGEIRRRPVSAALGAPAFAAICIHNRSVPSRSLALCPAGVRGAQSNYAPNQRPLQISTDVICATLRPIAMRLPCGSPLRLTAQSTRPDPTRAPSVTERLMQIVLRRGRCFGLPMRLRRATKCKCANELRSRRAGQAHAGSHRTPNGSRVGWSPLCAALCAPSGATPPGAPPNHCAPNNLWPEPSELARRTSAPANCAPHEWSRRPLAPPQTAPRTNTPLVTIGNLLR